MTTQTSNPDCPGPTRRIAFKAAMADLVERWRTELFNADGTLNDKLVGSAA